MSIAMVAKEKREYFIKPLSMEILNSFTATMQQLPETAKVQPYLQCPHMIPEFESSTNTIIGYRPMVHIVANETKTIKIGRQTITLEGCVYKCAVCNDKFWWLSPTELGYTQGMSAQEIESTVHRNSIEAMANISFLFSSMLHQEKLTRGTKEINNPAVIEYTGPKFLSSLADTSVGPKSGGVKRLNGIIMMLTVDAYVKVFSTMKDILNGKTVTAPSDMMDVLAVKPFVGNSEMIHSVTFQASPSAPVKPISNYGFAIGDVTPNLVGQGKAQFVNGVATGAAPGMSGGAVTGMPPVAPPTIAE